MHRILKSADGEVIGEVRRMTKRRGYILSIPNIQWRAGMPTRRGGATVKRFDRVRDAIEQCKYIHANPACVQTKN